MSGDGVGTHPSSPGGPNGEPSSPGTGQHGPMEVGVAAASPSAPPRLGRGAGSASPPRRRRKEPRRAVTYDGRSHLLVLLQLHGSVWPSVLPYCVANGLVMYGVIWCLRGGFDMTVASDGHSFMSMLVSFLVVTRALVTYNRYEEARGLLADLLRCCRELAHHAAVLTMHQGGDGVRRWRIGVMYRTAQLLRVSLAALEYRSEGVSAWDVMAAGASPRIGRGKGGGGDVDDFEDVADRGTMRAWSMGRKLSLSKGDDGDGDGDGDDDDDDDDDASEAEEQWDLSQRPKKKKWAQTARSLNFFAPIVVARKLRHEIAKCRAGPYLPFPAEMKVLSYVSDYVTALESLNEMISTPFPFPLVQMSRTFLFAWVYTLPFVLARDMEDEPVQAVLVAFFIAYGFIGLEYVSMELDDPFGEDPNDFDDLALAQMVFEDMYITLHKVDGPGAADELRDMVVERLAI